MEWLVIYLMVMVERIGELLNYGWAVFYAGIACLGGTYILCAILQSDYDDIFSELMEGKHAKTGRKAGKWLIAVGLIIGTLSYLVPSQKEVAIIAGAGMTYKAVTSETGQRIGGKAISLLEQRIEDALKDTPEPVKPSDLSKK